jgi:hypothetical protein
VPRRRTFDSADVDALLRRNDGVASHRQLVQVGMSVATIARWANKGPWQRALPGVIAGHRGPLSLRQRRRAALSYAGEKSVISGDHALDLLGIAGDRLPVGERVLVLIPWAGRRLSTGFVTIERTQRPPSPIVRQGLLVAGPARAAADAARHDDEVDRVREVFGAVLQQRRTTVEALRDEVYDGPTQRTATARRVLEEVSAGTRSAAEGKIYRLVSTSALPQPLWNEDVVVDGIRIGHADAWWPELGVVLEIDSIRWHSTPEDLRRTQAKQRRYAAAGLLLLSVAPQDVLDDPAGFLRQLAATLSAATRRR